MRNQEEEQDFFETQGLVSQYGTFLSPPSDLSETRHGAKRPPRRPPSEDLDELDDDMSTPPNPPQRVPSPTAANLLKKLIDVTKTSSDCPVGCNHGTRPWSPPMLPPSPPPAAPSLSTSGEIVADSPPVPKTQQQQQRVVAPATAVVTVVISQGPERSSEWDKRDDELCRRGAEKLGDSAKPPSAAFVWPESDAAATVAEMRKRRRCTGARRIVLSAAAGGFVEGDDASERRRRLENVSDLVEEAKECKRNADKLSQQKGKEKEALNARLRTALVYLEAIAGLEALSTDGPAPPIRVSTLAQGCAELFRFYASQYRSSYPAHAVFFVRLEAIAFARRFRAHREKLKTVRSDVLAILDPRTAQHVGNGQHGGGAAAAAAVKATSPVDSTSPPVAAAGALQPLPPNMTRDLVWLLQNLDDSFRAGELWKKAEATSTDLCKKGDALARQAGVLRLDGLPIDVASMRVVLEWATAEVERLTIP